MSAMSVRVSLALDDLCLREAAAKGFPVWFSGRCIRRSLPALTIYRITLVSLQAPVWTRLLRAEGPATDIRRFCRISVGPEEQAREFH
jgi:hypothetical protein